MDRKDVKKILLSINPHIKNHLNRKTSLIHDGIIDSFDIMQFLLKVEQKKKKKIKFNKVSREIFHNLDTIVNFIRKL